MSDSRRAIHISRLVIRCQTKSWIHPWQCQDFSMIHPIAFLLVFLFTYLAETCSLTLVSQTTLTSCQLRLLCSVWHSPRVDAVMSPLCAGASLCVWIARGIMTVYCKLPWEVLFHVLAGLSLNTHWPLWHLLACEKYDNHFFKKSIEYEKITSRKNYQAILFRWTLTLKGVFVLAVIIRRRGVNTLCIS